MRRRTALSLLVLIVLSLGVAAQLTDRQKIDQALQLLSDVTPLTDAGRTNLANIRTRLNTLKTQVAQDPPACSYSISPTSQPAPAGGGSGGTTVTTTSACAWTAVSQSLPWLTVTSGTGGTGTGFVAMTATPNTGPARTGTVLVAGQTFTVTQGAGAGDPVVQCNDGLDNDSDGLIDLADPGCLSATDTTEDTNPPIAQCANGIDDDGDSLIDLADPGCTSSTDTDETNIVPPGPGVGVIWAMDCGTNGAAATLCGFTGEWNTPGFFTRAYQAGGPMNRGYVEYTAVPGTTQAQPYTGWGKNITHPSGQSRFMRFSLRIASGLNPSGVGDVWTDKFIILGQGSNDRMICQISPSMALSSDPSHQFLGLRCSKGIDGPPNAAEPVPITLGAFEKWQIEVRGGSNAVIKMWKNNGTYTAPNTASVGNFSLDSASWGVLGVGFYQNAAIGPTGSLAFAVGDFVWADTFDPNWR